MKDHEGCGGISLRAVRSPYAAFKIGGNGAGCSFPTAPRAAGAAGFAYF